MRLSGRALAGVTTALVTAVAVPALAFACTEVTSIQAGLFSGPALSQTTVSVNGFASAPVEVHWNSVTGPVLATVSGPAATAGVTIPAAGPAVYYLYAIQHTGGSTTRAVTVFEVTGPGGAAVRNGEPAVQTSPMQSEQHPGGGVSPITLGLLVLSSGVFLMAVGVGVADLRRRRVVAGVHRDGDS